MKNTDTSQLPPAIESQLANLELRHARHQQMLEDHKETRHQRREKHRKGWHKRRPLPIALI